MRADDSFLAVLPLTGVFGFNPTMAMLSAGGACVLEPVFDPRLVLSDVRRTGSRTWSAAMTCSAG